VNARILATALAVVLALAGAGTAAAGTGDGTSGTGTFDRLELAYLQIDKKTLLAKLKQGQTLAQIATARGKSPQGLIDTLVGAAKMKLDARVRAGKLGAADEASILAKLRTQLGKDVTKSLRPGTKVPGAYLQPVLAYLQIDDQTLGQELKSGKSLAQIAVAHGKTAAGVEAAILAPFQAQLDAQVTAGKLTPDDRDGLLTQAQASVTRLVAGNA
jgi:hypothetical protein